MQVDRGFLN